MLSKARTWLQGSRCCPFDEENPASVADKVGDKGASNITDVRFYVD